MALGWVTYPSLLSSKTPMDLGTIEVHCRDDFVYSLNRRCCWWTHLSIPTISLIMWMSFSKTPPRQIPLALRLILLRLNYAQYSINCITNFWMNIIARQQWRHARLRAKRSAYFLFCLSFLKTGTKRWLSKRFVSSTSESRTWWAWKRTSRVRANHRISMGSCDRSRGARD